MIKYIFDSKFISGNEIIFYIYVILIVTMIILSMVFGYKEIRKKWNL